jgi:hypothetical protein
MFLKYAKAMTKALVVRMQGTSSNVLSKTLEVGTPQ